MFSGFLPDPFKRITRMIFYQFNTLYYMEYDIAIIGGGPAGYTAAERASENGLKTLLFEKKTIGGVCLNEGCIPTKTLLYSAKVLDTIRTASKYGIQADNRPRFELEKIIARKDRTVRRLVSGIQYRLNADGVKTVQGEARIVGEEFGLLHIRCGEETYLAKKLLVCAGSETVIPPICGLPEIDYWTSREALEVKELPRSLAIIGGGVIGMEFASFFHSMDVKVKVIEMMPEILGNMDKECSAMLRNTYAKKGIEFYLRTQVTEVKPGVLLAEKGGDTLSIDAEKVLVSVGRKPVLSHLGLDKLGIEHDRRGIRVNEHMQTSHPHIYACGDITGFSLLAHTAYRESEVAVNHILEREDRMDYDPIPSVVYTNPEFASVGKTEDELKAQGVPFRIQKIPMTYSGRFMAENEGVNGLCKLVTDEHDRIIGCQLVGNPASEIIVIAGIAIQNKDTVETFEKNVFPHPTVSEIIHEILYI